MIILISIYSNPGIGYFWSKTSNSPYDAPKWYLQIFPVGYPDIRAINSTWIHGIGTVGGSHIGIYTRILLTFLVDHRTRPTGRQMKFWVDCVHYLKSNSVFGPLDFVT